MSIFYILVFTLGLILGFLLKTWFINRGTWRKRITIDAGKKCQ